jgi:hypothetical protein
MRRRWLLPCLIAGLTVLVASGCGDSNASVTLGRAKASPIEGLPVPAQAELQPAPRHWAEAYYLLPYSVSLTALNAWYRVRLVEGQSWRGWSPCHLPLRDPGTMQYAWKRRSSILDLSTSNQGNGQVRVVILEQDNPTSISLTC